MKKIFTSILMLGLCTFLGAQSILNISGIVSNQDGSAAEDAFLTLVLDNFDEPFFTQSNADGYYEFAVELGGDIAQGCFELYLIDCTFETIAVDDCYNPGNFNFNFDFVYCANGTDGCTSIVYSEVQDSSLLLSVITFGVAPYTYIWSNGSTESNITVGLDAGGIYCVTVTDAQDCESEGCIDLTPPDPCFVNIFEEYNFNSVILFAEGYGQTDDLDYEWNTGESGATIMITESGEYCVTLTDGLGCESVDCRFIEVDSTWFEPCFSYIYVTNGDSIETLNVESFGVAPFTYVWTLGDSILSTEQTYVPNQVGVYCVTVTDAEGCVYTACYDYFIWEDCGVWIGCDPIDNGVQLWAFGYGAEPIEYIWSNGDEGQELIATVNGEYCVTITDSEGCSSSACVNVVIEDVVECFTPIEIIEFPEYAELTINPLTDGQYIFAWSTGDDTPFITVEESGTYCVEVIEVESGCFFTTCATVFIGGQEECWGYIETGYSGDSSAVLTVVAFDMTSDSIGFQYIWSNGATTESIEVTEEGTYCVTVYGTANCVFETCTDVIFWDFPWQNSIVGTVFGTDPDLGIDATVDIYSVLDDGSLELYSEGNQTIFEGFYEIENVAPGHYIALATSPEDEYVPTYGFSTTSWELADVHEVGDNTAVTPLHIALIPITNLQGDGTIEGTVTTENLVEKGKEDDSRNGVPLEGANVMLMHSDIPARQIFTNDEGNFFFSDLPYETYTVVLEIPGYPQKTFEVTLSEDNPNVTDVEFETDFSTTSTNNISALSSLTLSPNPTSNTLVVDTYFEEAKDVIYRVIDMNGKIVKSSMVSAVMGKNSLQLDVTTMDKGVYNLVIQSNEELVAKRFIKM